jgi:hypothetical protein
MTPQRLRACLMRLLSLKYRLALGVPKSACGRLPRRSASRRALLSAMAIACSWGRPKRISVLMFLPIDDRPYPPASGMMLSSRSSRS